MLHLARRVAEAHERAVGVPLRHRQQVGAGAAAELEHPAAIDRRRLHAKQRGDCRQAVRVALSGRLARMKYVQFGSFKGDFRRHA